MIADPAWLQFWLAVTLAGAAMVANFVAQRMQAKAMLERMTAVEAKLDRLLRLDTRVSVLEDWRERDFPRTHAGRLGRHGSEAANE